MPKTQWKYQEEKRREDARREAEQKQREVEERIAEEHIRHSRSNGFLKAGARCVENPLDSASPVKHGVKNTDNKIRQLIIFRRLNHFHDSED